MGGRASKWAETVERHFGFLADHGFVPVAVDDSTFWATSVTYCSE